MKCCLIVFAAWAVVLGGSSLGHAQEMPELPKPTKEHEWLQKLVGQWDTVGKCSMGPDQPPMESEGSVEARMLGEFWMISEGKGEAMGTPVESVMQLGFDRKKGKYIGTWTDSVFDHLWHYVGTLEGDTLTLNAEGPNMADPSKMAKYRDVIEIKSADHYTLSSSMQGEDGQWTTFMTAEFTRKK